MSLRSWLAGWGAPLRVAYRRPEVGAAQQARADVLPTGGEQRAVAGWLAGAEQRRAEPLREDRPSDVADRLIVATRAKCAAELRRLMDVADAANQGPCPADPCPVCTVLEGMHSLARDWEA